MSRRIQIVSVTMGWPKRPDLIHPRSLHLRVYSQQGKATLEHDKDMMLAVIACAVCGGDRQLNLRLGWVVNGENTKDTRGNLAGQIVHGRDRYVSRCRDEEPVSLGEEILFDAGEEARDGRAVWKVATGSAWNNGRPDDILTPEEMLYSAATVLIGERRGA
jgi:hypothetical protein